MFFIPLSDSSLLADWNTRDLYGDFVSCNSTEFVYSKSYLAESSCFIYIMSLENSNNFTSFPTWMTYFLSYPFFLLGLPTVLNKSGKGWTSWLDLRGKAFHTLLFSEIHGFVKYFITFICWECIPSILTLLRVFFIMDESWIVSDSFFYAAIEMIVRFFLGFVNVASHIDFSDVEPFWKIPEEIYLDHCVWPY